MKQVFKAILHGDRVEWLDSAPESSEPIQVYVSVPEVKRGEDPEPGQESIVELFQALADSGAFADIEDPVAWQREILKDRPLPGKVLLDTNVIIYGSQERHALVSQFIQNVPFRIVSIVSYVEALGFHSLPEAERQLLERFFGEA